MKRFNAVMRWVAFALFYVAGILVLFGALEVALSLYLATWPWAVTSLLISALGDEDDEDEDEDE